MPNNKPKGKNQKEETHETEQSQPKILTADFNVKNLFVEPIKDMPPKAGTKESTQFNGFVRYDYGSTGSKKNDDNAKAEKQSTINRCVIVTQAIKISKGGIPKTDPNTDYRATDNDCLYFWLNLDQCEGGKDLRDNVLSKLDEMAADKINKKGNKDFIIKVGQDGSKAPLDKLKYTTICKKSADESSKGDKLEQYERVKVKIGTLYKPDEDKNAPKEIKIKVYDAQKDEEVKIKSLDDLRAAFPWGCTAEFALEVNKFWAMRTKKDGVRECGFGLKCLAINVVDKPKNNSAQVIDKSIFGTKTVKKVEDEDEDENEDDDNKSSSESESESESDSESESENEGNQKDESEESESEDDEEEKPKKGTTKKNNKNKKSSDHESDDEKLELKKGSKEQQKKTTQKTNKK